MRSVRTTIRELVNEAAEKRILVFPLARQLDVSIFESDSQVYPICFIISAAYNFGNVPLISFDLGLIDWRSTVIRCKLPLAVAQLDIPKISVWIIEDHRTQISNSGNPSSQLPAMVTCSGIVVAVFVALLKV